jgi:hypothetical protein
MDMPGIISSDYTYYDDGRLENISSVDPSGGATQLFLHRQHYYDELGRFSGMHRAGDTFETGGTGYNITYAYNAFDNMESKNHTYSILGSTVSAYSTTWLNNRNQDPKIGQGGYDNAGNMKRYDNRIYTYNSVGKSVSMSDFNLSYAYDGDGFTVKEVRTSPPQQGVPANLLNYATYFVRSTVLGGKVVMELDGSGQRKWDYIYGAGGALLAEHNPTGQEMPGHKFGPRDIPAQPQGDYVPFIPAQPNRVLWRHMDPHGAMAWTTRTDGSLIRQNVQNSYTNYEIQETDLEGNIVDYRLITFGIALNQSVQLLSGLTFISPYLGNTFNPGAGCTIDGIEAPCSTAISFANSAAGAIQLGDILPTPTTFPRNTTSISWGALGDLLLSKLPSTGIVNADPITPPFASGFLPSQQVGNSRGDDYNRSFCGQFVDDLIWTAVDNSAYEAGRRLLLKARQYATNGGGRDQAGWESFKDHLTAGTQQGQVYQHILGHAGASLIGDNCILPGCLLYKFPGLPDGMRASTGTELSMLTLAQDHDQLAHPTARHTPAEAQAEIDDDNAGIWIADQLRGITNTQSKFTRNQFDNVRAQISDRICNNGGYLTERFLFRFPNKIRVKK